MSMSTKKNTSSKNKKAISKKVAPKKVIKKAAPKKVVKKAIAKKVVKLVAKKIAKPVKKVVKAVVKKTIKKVAAKAKVIVKKVAPKKVVKVAAKKTIKPLVKAKPAKKVVAKKVIVAKKITTSKAVVKAVKPVVVKEIKLKVEKIIVPKPVKVKAPAKVKAPKGPIKAPTTFRNAEVTTGRVSKEPAGKFEMEFVVRASEDMVFEFVSSESGLSEWFCDDVNIRNGIFTFTWDGQEQQARLVKEQPPLYIRYQWLDKNDGSFFEFRTQKDDLTNDISLIVTDFADSKADEQSARLLWASQIDKLLHVLGSVF